MFILFPSSVVTEKVGYLGSALISGVCEENQEQRQTIRVRRRVEEVHMTKKDNIEQIHQDSKPQFAPGKKSSRNNGVSSAKPRVITGSDDATINKAPPGAKKPSKDWDINYDP